MIADLTHVDTWLFDLDNTLYPAESGFMAEVTGRMTDFVQKVTGLPRDQAFRLQKDYLAEHGINPDTDVQIRVTPPPEMVANLRAGNIDGFLGPDPFNQRAVYDEVGFIHILTKELWDGHPCCAFGTSTEFIQKTLRAHGASFMSVIPDTSPSPSA